MRIHVLVENTSSRADLVAEHGLSLLIEACGQRILFDMGASGVFADNAARMGLSLSDVDVAVLSHGHYDHGGGLERFLQLNERAEVWVSAHAFDPHFNATGKDIGLATSLENHPRIRRLTGGYIELAEGVWLHSAEGVDMQYPPEGAGMTAIIDGERVADDFRHEQYLLLEEGGRRVLISGCSHRGVLNIAACFRADVLVGGFHYMKADPVEDAESLRAAALRLMNLPTCYYTGHCTGDVAYGVMLPLMGERLQGISTGQVIEL